MDSRLRSESMSTLSHIAPAIILLLSVAGTAWAHTTTEPAPESFRELWTSWPVEPVSWFALGLLAWFYLRGLRRIWRAIGVGCGLGYFEVGCFAAGWLALAVALVSPLHPWGKALFSAHMTQHEILMLVAAPLAVLGRPVIAVLKGFSPDTTGDLLAVARAPVIRQIIAFVASPFVAWAIHAAVLWAWHIPACFQATLTNDWIHALQHTTFLFSALLFWWAV